MRQRQGIETTMTQRAFVTKRGRANFTCPECGATKQMDVSKFKEIDKRVKLKCTCVCKHVFSAVLERRQHVRRSVELDGELVYRDLKAHIKVVDVSRIGLKIITRTVLDLETGSKVIVKFTLDDVTRSQVTKETIIKSINDTQIGLEFVSSDHYDKFENYILFQST